jgi:4,5-DOPA dioxygenase extradiol
MTRDALPPALPPALFVSHGAPDLLLTPSPTRDFLRELGARIGRPRFVAVASAHWTTREPAVDVVARPETIHDFSGFGRALDEFEYAAPGAPDAARRAAQLLSSAGVAALTTERGLDHGAWVVLALLWPDAKVPAFQVAVQPRADARHHFELGRALAPLVNEGGLVIGSGGATHRLAELGRRDDGECDAFDEWLVRAVESGATEELLDWRRRAPFADHAHPTPEHFLPLFVALGAAAGSSEPASWSGKTLHRSVEHGSLHLTAFELNSRVD